MSRSRGSDRTRSGRNRGSRSREGARPRARSRSRSPETTSVANPLVAKIVPGLLILVGVGITIAGIVGMRRAKESASWPEVRGHIVSSSVDSKISTNTGKRDSKPRSKKKRTYFPKIRYQYSVEGKTFTGTRIAYGDLGSESKSSVRRIVSRYPTGKEVSVFYRPSDPKECLLEPGVKGQTWFLPVFGLLFCVGGIVMAVSTRRSK